MQDFDKRPSRLAALPLAIVFLFETWVWRKLVALAQYLAGLLPWERFRDAARRVLDRAPAIVSVALFGVPLAVSEGGAFVSVVMMATGHLFLGAALYVAMKIFGLFLVPLIFELTRQKLLSLPWFAYVYAKFEALHAMASRFVAPYRQVAREYAEAALASFQTALRALYNPPRSAARASAANDATLNLLRPRRRVEPRRAEPLSEIEPARRGEGLQRLAQHLAALAESRQRQRGQRRRPAWRGARARDKLDDARGHLRRRREGGGGTSNRIRASQRQPASTPSRP